MAKAFKLFISYKTRGEKNIVEFDTAEARQSYVESDLRADAATIDWDSEASKKDWISYQLESLEYGQSIEIDMQHFEYV